MISKSLKQIFKFKSYFSSSSSPSISIIKLNLARCSSTKPVYPQIGITPPLEIQNQVQQQFIKDDRLQPKNTQTSRELFPHRSNQSIRAQFGLPLKRQYKKSNYCSIVRGQIIWHLFDLSTYPLGRAAMKIAHVLQGKHRPTYKRNILNTKDRIVVVNCDNPRLSGRKLLDKVYYKHTGYPGGLRQTPILRQLDKKPDQVLKHAVSGMLPKNKLRKDYFQYIYQFEGQFHDFHHIGLPQFAYQQVEDVNKIVGFDSITPQNFELVHKGKYVQDDPQMLDISKFKIAEDVEIQGSNFQLQQAYTQKKIKEKLKKKYQKLQRRYKTYSRR